MTPVFSAGELARIQESEARIRSTDEALCYSERELLLDGVPALAGRPREYAETLERLLSGLSTPIENTDIFLSRPVYGALPASFSGAASVFNPQFRMSGHLTPDYESLINKGLKGILCEIEAAANEHTSTYSSVFYECAVKAVNSVEVFARRYAASARIIAENAAPKRKKELLRAAKALETVPSKPAYDFFSALQSVIFVHVLLSCFVGGRDFALGRMDVYLSPYYERDLYSGIITEGEAAVMLSDAFLRMCEIGGYNSINGKARPLPCNASKQYIVLGGFDKEGRPYCSELGRLIVRVVSELKLPQPTLCVRISADMDGEWKNLVYSVMPGLSGQIQLFNDDVINSAMLAAGFPKDIACDHTFSACNRTDYTGGYALEHYHNMAAWLLEAFEKAVKENADFTESIARNFGDIAMRDIVGYRARYFPNTGPRFHFESLLLRGCAQNACDAENNGTDILAKCHYFSGIATVADSLAAINEAVHKRRLLTLAELWDCVKNNFKGRDALAAFLRTRCPKYGNGDEQADHFAKMVSDAVFTAIEKANEMSETGIVNYGGFYSLFKHHRKNWIEQATPDGRRALEPLSENQSPVYGADRQGVTSLLQSVTETGLRKSAIGGLNITFAQKPSPETLSALLDVYFTKGGVHAGVTVADRRTLEDALAHPKKYPTLYVRVTGYSELFTSLPPHMQQEIINRTQY